MIEAMKQWLEALEINLVFLRNVKPFKGQEDLASDCIAMTEETITSLRQAIAEAEKQVPVAFVVDRFQGQNTGSTMPEPLVIWIGRMEIGDKLYTHPQPRTWVGLTDEEVKDIVWNLPYEPSQEDIRAIEAKLKELNT